MTVDGGTNHLYNTFVNDRELYVPDLITGDFDSIRCKVKKYYEEKVGVHTNISTYLTLSMYSREMQEFSHSIQPIWYHCDVL